MQIYEMDSQLCLFVPDGCAGRTSQAPLAAENQRERTSALSWRKYAELSAIPFQSLDLTPGAGNLLDEFYWELISPWRGESSTLNTGASPKDAVVSSLSQILEAAPHPRYYLSAVACLGILRRAKERGKALPLTLESALRIQAGLPPMRRTTIPTGDAYHINQRNEGIDLGGVSGALMHTPDGAPAQAQRSGLRGERSRSGMSELSPLGGSEGYGACGDAQMQTFVTQPEESIAFAANQRDEVRDLHDIAGALGAQPGMKQQTFVAAFCAGAGPSAGGIGYTEDGSPTLKASESGTNMVPTVLCLNDQGGKRTDLSEDVSGSLRSQEKGHQPLVMATQQGGAEIAEDLCPTITSAAGTSGNNQPVLYEGHGHDQRYKPMTVSPTLSSAAGMGGGNIPLIGQGDPLLYENHGIDSRYTGPHPVAPTMSARYGTGGNNVPLIEQEEPETYCIVGNVIDRQPENGGNGKGYQEDLAYTLTATDHHAVFARQRTDVFSEGDIASTESARQYKDATDLVMQETVGALTSSDRKGPNSQYVSQDKCIVEGPRLIRRLTPLECERLQGFPDGWTDIPGASDSARYKALGNSVAIPCVEYIMAGIVEAMGGAL